MAKKDSPTVQKVSELARPAAEELGLILWDVRFEKEGASWFLRVFIDKADGVSIDDCEAMSRKLDPLLDEADPIEQSYYLEVSSPGLGRELRKPDHFAFAVGKEIRLHLIRPDGDGLRDFTGVLAGYDGGVLSLHIDGETRCFDENACAYIKLDDDSDIGFNLE